MKLNNDREGAHTSISKRVTIRRELDGGLEFIQYGNITNLAEFGLDEVKHRGS